MRTGWRPSNPTSRKARQICADRQYGGSFSLPWRCAHVAPLTRCSGTVRFFLRFLKRCTFVFCQNTQTPQWGHRGFISNAPDVSPYINSSASASSCITFSSLTADLICTVFCANVMFLLFSSILIIVFAAVGAHEPFSISATVRFW